MQKSATQPELTNASPVEMYCEFNGGEVNVFFMRAEGKDPQNEYAFDTNDFADTWEDLRRGCIYFQGDGVMRIGMTNGQREKNAISIKNKPNDRDYNGIRYSAAVTLTVTRNCVVEGHDLDEGVVTTEPTCTATGVKKAVCELCGAEYGQVDSGKHENLVCVPAQAATAETEGNIEYRHCDACGGDFADEEGRERITKTDIIVKKLPGQNGGSGNDGASGGGSGQPATGDGGAVIWLAALAVSFALGAAVLTRRRKNRA